MVYNALLGCSDSETQTRFWAEVQTVRTLDLDNSIQGQVIRTLYCMYCRALSTIYHEELRVFRCSHETVSEFVFRIT